MALSEWHLIQVTYKDVDLKYFIIRYLLVVSW